VRVLPPDATDDEIVTLCREWVDLMAAGRTPEALDLLWIPDDYDDSQRWTPARLVGYIANYGNSQPTPDGTRWTITPPEAAAVGERGAPRKPEVGRLDDHPSSGWVDYDLPLNGEWSDLTAQFEFRRVEGGTRVSLYDLHVL
jgi:hypothetical protein